MSTGFDRLADAVKSQLTMNKCVTTWGHSDLAAATKPSAKSFWQFAFLSSGLAIGFPSDPNGPLHKCGSAVVVIPYEELSGALSPSGEWFMKTATAG
jgi:hypothetical protein